jgi:hypothetical protein
MTLWQEEPNVVILQFVKGGSLPWPHLNECMHRKWCICDPMMEWPKGDYLSSHENPCVMKSPSITCKRKSGNFFLVCLIYFCKFWTFGLGVLGTSHTMPIDGSKRMRTCKPSFTTQCVHLENVKLVWDGLYWNKNSTKKLWNEKSMQPLIICLHTHPIYFSLFGLGFFKMPMLIVDCCYDLDFLRPTKKSSW